MDLIRYTFIHGAFLYGSRVLTSPGIFGDAAYGESCHWRLSTSNVTSPPLRLFGFGPAVEDG